MKPRRTFGCNHYLLMPEFTITARYIFPVDQAPIPNGTITVHDQRIASVAPEGQHTPDDDLGNVALLPGFVNAHTHLDLSGLAGKCPPSSNFTNWLRSVIAHRRQQTSEQINDDIRDGLRQALETGTTLLGDISSEGLSRSILADAPIWSVVFCEMLGLPIERARQMWDAAQQWLHDWPISTRCRPGLSPHAPYSVHRQLMKWAAETEVPVSIHLAETQAEHVLLTQRDGPFVPFLEELGVWEPSGLAASFDDVIETFSAHPRTIFVHGNFLNADALPDSDATIVYCPRTHHAFGHPPHSFRALLDCGVRVALGTDSLASNPDLDMLAETRFLHRQYPDVPGDVLLRMATLNGAEALGRHEITGSLTPGKSADIVVVPLPSEERDDPHDLVLESEEKIRRVMWRGEWVL